MPKKLAKKHLENPVSLEKKFAEVLRAAPSEVLEEELNRQLEKRKRELSSIVSDFIDSGKGRKLLVKAVHNYVNDLLSEGLEEVLGNEIYKPVRKKLAKLVVAAFKINLKKK